MAAVVVMDDRDSIQWRRRSMASVMDYDERTRGRHKDRQRNNQPAR